MSHGQATRWQADQEPVKYGDVFQVSGELASEPVAPRDAAAAQKAEMIAFGQTQKGGPAAVMQSAADVNLRCGVLGHDDVTEATMQHGVTISQVDAGGELVITEAVGGEGAASKLPGDKAVTKEDADVAVAALLRNKLDMSTQVGGVAAAMVAAADLNNQQQIGRV